MTENELLLAIYQDTQDLKTRMTGMETRMTSMETRMTSMETRITKVETKLSNLEIEIGSIKTKISHLEARTASIETTLDNETNRNIRIIAEAHLDLTRKLDDALKVENEKEMMLIKVNYLDNEFKKIKEQMKETNRTA